MRRKIQEAKHPDKDHIATEATRQASGFLSVMSVFCLFIKTPRTAIYRLLSRLVILCCLSIVQFEYDKLMHFCLLVLFFCSDSQIGCCKSSKQAQFCNGQFCNGHLTDIHYSLRG